MARRVPWEVQVVNTCPENFGFVRGKAQIQLEAAGLYQITLGFYANCSQANCKVFLNEEVMLSRDAPLAKLRKQHPAGAVTGLTLNDFIALPAHASISVQYEQNSSSQAEGFLTLRKL